MVMSLQVEQVRWDHSQAGVSISWVIKAPHKAFQLPQQGRLQPRDMTPRHRRRRRRRTLLPLGTGEGENRRESLIGGRSSVSRSRSSVPDHGSLQLLVAAGRVCDLREQAHDG